MKQKIGSWLERQFKKAIKTSRNGLERHQHSHTISEVLTDQHQKVKKKKKKKERNWKGRIGSIYWTEVSILWSGLLLYWILRKTYVPLNHSLRTNYVGSRYKMRWPWKYNHNFLLSHMLQTIPWGPMQEIHSTPHTPSNINCPKCGYKTTIILIINTPHVFSRIFIMHHVLQSILPPGSYLNNHISENSQTLPLGAPLEFESIHLLFQRLWNYDGWVSYYG